MSFKSHCVYFDLLRFRILKCCSFPGWIFNIHAPDLPTGFSGSNVKCSGGRPGPPSSAPPFPPSPVSALFVGLPSLCRVHFRSSQFSSVQFSSGTNIWKGCRSVPYHCTRVACTSKLLLFLQLVYEPWIRVEKANTQACISTVIAEIR